MFDFINNTYSGILSILSTLFGLSYPLVIGCIERIDSKFGSTKLSERFLNEFSFKHFKYSLIINLVMAVLSPFFMDGSTHARLMIGLQCIGAIVLVSSSFLLFSKIMSYYNIGALERMILRDYKKAVKVNDKAKEAEYFTQWIDLSSELLKSVDETLTQSIHKTLSNYVAKAYKNGRDEELVFDPYYYEGISRINEALCRGESRSISANNTNSILSSLILLDSIVSDTTYRYLWRNLRIQISYKKDAWIMAYWEAASQKMGLYLDPRLRYSYVENTEEEIKNKQRRDEFLEFHVMLCAMLAQEKKYQLLGSMLSFTQTEPPSYPLVPSTLGDIINIFNRINNNARRAPLFYESRYQMPNMYGLTDGQIVGAANYYLALLAYRIYTIRWDFGPNMVLSLGALPRTLSELRTLKDNLGVFRYWLERVSSNKELLSAIGCESCDEVFEKKKQSYNSDIILKPHELVSEMEKHIGDAMEDLRKSQPLSEEKVSTEKEKVTNDISEAMNPYTDILGKRFEQGKTYNLNSSVTMPFENTALVKNPDVGHFGIAECMTSYMIPNFQHLFASSFYQENASTVYNLSSEDLFDGIDRLVLNEEHYIIAFGINLEHYIGRVTNLQKDRDSKYIYKGVKIVLLGCPTEYFSQMLYVMRSNDLPFLTFHKPSEEEQKELYLDNTSEQYGLWLSLEKVADHPELLEGSMKTELGDDANKYSLFTAIWKPVLTFKSERHPVVCIKVKYRPTNEGNYDSIDKVKPFPKDDSPL